MRESAAPDATAVGTSEAEPARGGIRSLRTFESLHNPTFRLFFVATLGQMAALNAQMLVRGWLVFELTGSFTALGLIGLASAAPMLFLTVIGGVVADRAPKKIVLQAGLTVAMVVAFTVAALVLADVIRFWHLVVASLVQGTAFAIMLPAGQSIIPEIVGRERLMNALSLNAAGMNLMRLAAPAAGGFLIVFAGTGTVYVLIGSMYIVSILALMALPTSRPTPRGDGSGLGVRSGLADLNDGRRYIMSHPQLRPLLVMNIITAILGMPFVMMLPGFVSEVFGKGAGHLAALTAAGGAGALVGALVIASLPPKRRGLLLLMSAILLAGGLLLFTASGTFWLSMVLMAVVGFATAGRQALGMVLLQTFVEDEYRGRVMSIFMLQISLMLLGAFLVGLTAESIGVQIALGAMAAALLVVMTWMLIFMPVFRRMD